MRLSMVSEVPILQRRMPDTPVAAWKKKKLNMFSSASANLLLFENSKLNSTRSDGDDRKFGGSGSIVWHKLRLGGEKY